MGYRSPADPGNRRAYPLDTSHKPARVQSAPGIEFFLYPAAELEPAAQGTPHLDPLLEGQRGLAYYHAPAPPGPDLPELFDDLALRLFVPSREPDVGDAVPGVGRDARRDAPARAGPERRVQDARELRRRSGDLEGHPTYGARRLQGTEGLCLPLGERPNLAEASEKVGSRLCLRFDGRRYSFDENRQEPGFFTPVQLHSARDELGVQDRLRRLVRSGRTRELDSHGLSNLGFRVQPEVALCHDAERAQRAGEEFGEVVAGYVLDHLAAGLGYSPIRENHSYADDEVPDRPVAVAARPR